MTTDALARLREQVRRLERRDLSRSQTDILATGHSAVDTHLGGGLRTGSLHDFLLSDPLEIGASLAMLLPILKEGRGPIFWISDTPAELNACGLHQSGVSLDHLVCIETDPASLLAVAEDVLRGPERALAVIAGSHVPTLKEIRRLNLAVEASGNTGFFPALCTARAHSRERSLRVRHALADPFSFLSATIFSGTGHAASRFPTPFCRAAAGEGRPPCSLDPRLHRSCAAFSLSGCPSGAPRAFSSPARKTSRPTGRSLCTRWHITATPSLVSVRLHSRPD